MGIIMERLSNSIPQLQSAISSGLENVTSGIAESVKASGVSAIEDSFKIFSASNMGIIADANSLPAVANVAEYPDPITSLAAHTNGSSDADSLLQTLQNPKFAPEAELATFTEAKVNETFKDLAKVRPDQIGDIYPPPVVFSDRELPYVSAANDNLRTMPNKAESESAQSRILLKNDSLLTPDPQLEKEMMDLINKKQKQMEEQKWISLKESLGQVDQLPYATTDGSTAATKEAESSAFTQIADALPITADSGTASATTSLEARGIIIVGGKPAEPDLLALTAAGTPSSNTLEARGIIIVGGKTDGTYFQTIDDSVNDLRNDPQPETLLRFRSQIKAVQDMTSTSMEAVNLFRQFSVTQRGFVR